MNHNTHSLTGASPMHTPMHSHVHTPMHTDMYTHPCIHTPMHTHTHWCTHTCTPTHTCTHTHVHTPMHAQSEFHSQFHVTIRNIFKTLWRQYSIFGKKNHTSQNNITSITGLQFYLNVCYSESAPLLSDMYIAPPPNHTLSSEVVTLSTTGLPPYNMYSSHLTWGVIIPGEQLSPGRIQKPLHESKGGQLFGEQHADHFTCNITTMMNITSLLK